MFLFRENFAKYFNGSGQIYKESHKSYENVAHASVHSQGGHLLSSDADFQWAYGIWTKGFRGEEGKGQKVGKKVIERRGLLK
jgi:hypothetical protein